MSRVPTDHQAPSQETVTTATTRNLGGMLTPVTEEEQELVKATIAGVVTPATM